MKKQILTLIIGILIGSIITTGVFLVLKNNEGNNMPKMNDSSFRERLNNMEFPSRGESNEETKEEQSN